ncbi:hypothetical protein, partial [Mycobacterium sp. E1214]|uniref:hypothetical protein n=1 Tax=Mycobacterium sp. E1214 TaxID=1834123 RepID=UPI0026F4228F
MSAGTNPWKSASPGAGAAAAGRPGAAGAVGLLRPAGSAGAARPAGGPAARAEARGVTYVEPVLVGEVRYSEWTP